MVSRFTNSIVDAGVVRLTALFADGSASPIQALDTYEARIARFNPGLNAFLAVDNAGARRDAEASARRWTYRAPLSRLDGVPLAIKANIAVEGLAWHAGVGALKGQVATRDADCVARLRAAGAVILGVVNLHEAALGATNDNRAFGRCHNPYRQGMTPGGSSGGSAAAVAAGLCAAALGTDTLGSVRIPAAFCGLFGHKPAQGWTSMAGVIPLAPPLDDLGLLTRSAEDAAALTRALDADHPPASAALQGLRWGVLDLGVPLEPSIAAAFAEAQAAARSLGLSLAPVRLDGWNVTAMRRLSLMAVEFEALAEYVAHLDRDPEGFSPELSAMLRWAQRQPADRADAVRQDLAKAAQALRAQLSAFDVVIMPSTPVAAFDFGEAEPAHLADFTLLANVAGLAATAFPLGLTPDGRPVGAQVVSADASIALQAGKLLAQPPSPPQAFRR